MKKLILNLSVIPFTLIVCWMPTKELSMLVCVVFVIAINILNDDKHEHTSQN